MAFFNEPVTISGALGVSNNAMFNQLLGVGGSPFDTWLYRADANVVAVRNALGTLGTFRGNRVEVGASAARTTVSTTTLTTSGAATLLSIPVSAASAHLIELRLAAFSPVASGAAAFIQRRLIRNGLSSGNSQHVFSERSTLPTATAQLIGDGGNIVVTVSGTGTIQWAATVFDTAVG